MRQQIIEMAVNRIRERRHRAEAEYSSKIEFLCKDPEYFELDKLYSHEVMKNARQFAYKQPVDDSVQKSLLETLKAMRASHGVSESPNYSCKICKDMGFVSGERCECLCREISQILLEKSGFETLENIDTSAKTAGELEKLYLKMKEWCSCPGKDLVFLTGQSGVGKTHLMRCMANEFILHGKIIKISTSTSLMRECSASGDEAFIDCDVLFIDDLGTEPEYKNTNSTIYTIINDRRMKHLPTVITSNLDLGEILDKYGERIFSRIADKKNSIVVKLSGKNRRLS